MAPDAGRARRDRVIHGPHVGSRGVRRGPRKSRRGDGHGSGKLVRGVRVP